MNNRIDAKIKQEFRQKHKQRLMHGEQLAALYGIE